MYRLRTRPHPVAMFLIVLLLGPYLLAAALLFVVAYTIATIFDMIAGRP